MEIREECGRKEEKAPRERLRVPDLDEQAMLEQDRALIEQLQRREPTKAVRKKPPTPPKAHVTAVFTRFRRCFKAFCPSKRAQNRW